MNIELQKKVLKWSFESDDVGMSSKAMAAASTGHAGGKSHPWDPSDLNRCIKLLHEVPEVRENLEKVAQLSKSWKKLIERWDELEKCFIDEVGYDWKHEKSATKTYKLMKEILK